MRRLVVGAKRGDTIIEVLFATTIFCVVAVSCIGLMNSTLASSETTLESTMARNEIDAQAEAIRFIRNTYITAKNNGDTSNVGQWQKLVENARVLDDTNGDILAFHQNNCADNATSATGSSFVIDTHSLNVVPITSSNSNVAFNAPVYSRVYDAEPQGIWAFAIKSAANNPQFYDFYIRACWSAPGRSNPVALGTLIRLNNPDYNNPAGGL